MGTFGMLFGGVQRMNAAPDQQQFAKLLVPAAEDPTGRGEANLINWLVKQHWRPKEPQSHWARFIDRKDRVLAADV